MYRFDHPEPRDNRGFGACHGVEIPFAFDTATREELRPLIGDTPSQAVADQAHRVWVDFITHGDPGWARYDTARRTTGLLTEPTTVDAAATTALRTARRTRPLEAGRALGGAGI